MDKKEKILRLLKVMGMVSISRIAHEIKSDIWMAKKYIEDLESEGKVKKIQTPNATYWELKKWS